MAADFGEVAPGVVAYIAYGLFRELWLRPALAPRVCSALRLSTPSWKGDRQRTGWTHMRSAAINAVRAAGC